jgi:hypothetical protein
LNGMKNKNIKIGFLLLIIFSFSSCEEWLDVNSDPSFPQEASAEVILPPLFQDMVRGEAFDSRYFGSYVQNWARTVANVTEDCTVIMPAVMLLVKSGGSTIGRLKKYRFDH